MGRYKSAPYGFACPYVNACPHLEGLSANWIFKHYLDSGFQEHRHRLIRESMRAEITDLQRRIQEQDCEIEQLRVENRLLHQRGFKPGKSNSRVNARADIPASTPKPRGAPKGHPPWVRKTPERIDRHLHVEAPLFCPHCQSATDASCGGVSSYVQEDIEMVPRTVVTSYTHDTAHCPQCRRQVIQPVDGELPFAPIGPNAKAIALYLRHGLKLPYRKINSAMKTLFGLDFVAASTLGFEKRARPNAQAIHGDLMEKMRLGSVVHADETHWREDGNNFWLWYAGNESVAVFRIDPHRSSEAAKALLGEKIDGLLVTDAYAAYNAIQCDGGRQSCLAHLLRKSKEVGEELAAIKDADRASVHFCQKIKELFQEACKAVIPKSLKARKKLALTLREKLDAICKNPLTFAKAETLRKRLIPSSREYAQIFAFIETNGPPTNNHAERSLRPLVIFRKICHGTRSPDGSENVAIFASLTQTAALQKADLLEVFRQLFKASPSAAQDIIFGPLTGLN